MCSLSYLVHVSNSPLSARGRHHGIALGKMNVRCYNSRLATPWANSQSCHNGSCCLSFPVHVSNSPLSARGRHHGIALGNMDVRCYNFRLATPWANSQSCHTIFVQTMCSSCLLKTCKLTSLTCFRSVGAGSCSMSFPVQVSNSPLSARGRHHGIALSRDERFIKI